MNTGQCRIKRNWKQVAFNILTIVSSIITIGAAVSMARSSDGITISLNLAEKRSEPTVIVLAPTPQPLPTFTPSPANTSTPMPLPTNTVASAVTPVPTPDLVELKHIVKPGEIMACIAKLYYNSPDAQDELCAYNNRHSGSALYGKSTCSMIFPGNTIMIPRSLIAVVITDTYAGYKGWVILNANTIEQPNNAFLCQNVP